MTNGYILLTGATGQIGRYLLRDLLTRGRQVAVLIRPGNGMTPQQRLEHVIADLQSSGLNDFPTPVCIDGDTTADGFGLSADHRNWATRNCNTLLHCAARVEFTGKGVGATWNNNVSSSKNTVDFCRDVKVDHLAYISTAYVCGKRTGTIQEDNLDAGQSFRNEYEESKFESEKILRRSFDSSQLTVLRPAIVVGDSVTGKTTNFHSFYRYAQFTSIIAASAPKDAAGRWTHNIRLATSENNRLNLVSVDWVSSAIVEILSGSDCVGKTYHLTPRTATTLGQIEQALQQYFKYDGVTFAGTDVDLSDASTDELRFYEYVSSYSDYWEEDPLFDRTNSNAATAAIPEQEIDVPCLMRLIDYAVQTRFGKQRKLAKAAQ